MKRAVWVRGGLRRSCGPWDPEVGKTAFYPAGLHYLHRIIEEPNPFSVVARSLMASGYLAKVDGFEYMLSSYEDIPLSQKICFAGEVGLSGEIRAVNRVDQRISEAEKLGFENIVISKYNRRAENHKGIKTLSVALVEEVYRMVFGK